MGTVRTLRVPSGAGPNAAARISGTVSESTIKRMTSSPSAGNIQRIDEPVLPVGPFLLLEQSNDGALEFESGGLMELC